MDESIELWSAPWHSLQRDLARGLRMPEPMPARPNAAAAGSPPPGSHWLGRARRAYEARIAARAGNITE